jgi:hypothetical protein
MKETTVFIIFFIVLAVSSILLYEVFISFKQEAEIKKMNKICSDMTDVVNAKVTNNTSYTHCYCYYAPYAPPKGLEDTRTMCVCDCKLRNGNMTKIQVLTPA